MKKPSPAIFLVPLFIGCACTACNKVHLAKPIQSAKLRPKVAPGPGQRLGATGTAERLENGDWRLTLVFAGVGPESVEGIRLLDEPHPLPLLDADGKLAVAWEVPRKRWLDGTPFELSLRLNGRDSEVPVTVRYRGAEFEPTPLGYVVQHALAVAIGSGL